MIVQKYDMQHAISRNVDHRFPTADLHFDMAQKPLLWGGDVLM